MSRELKKIKKQLSLFIKKKPIELTSKDIEILVKGLSDNAKADILNNFIDGKLLINTMKTETLKELIKAYE